MYGGGKKWSVALMKRNEICLERFEISVVTKSDWKIEMKENTFGSSHSKMNTIYKML